jgi:hypothetical protein
MNDWMIFPRAVLGLVRESWQRTSFPSPQELCRMHLERLVDIWKNAWLHRRGK